MKKDKYLTRREATEQYGISPASLGAAILRGTLVERAVRVLAKRIARRDIEAYLARTGGKRGRPKKIANSARTKS